MTCASRRMWYFPLTAWHAEHYASWGGTMRMKLSLALAGHAAGCAGLVAIALPAAAQEAAVAEQVIVTGSAIKRVPIEGPAPVEIIRRAEIAATGATTINELMKSIATMDIYDQGELDSSSPAGSGTTFVRMRGLDETNVLVLLNGHRLPINALYDVSGQGGAVDINMIPLGAIERIEILKDGGSAIYGADAVAGVVNLITRKTYRGAEVKVGYGTSSRNDGTEKQVSVAGGMGSLAEDGYNLLVSFENFRRDPILRKDRDISSSADFRRLGGGDYRSSFSPYGNLLDADFNFSGATVRPCPPALYNDRCRYDYNASLLTAQNGADRSSAMLIGSLRLGPRLTGSAQVLHTESRNRFEAHPVPDFFVLPGGDIYTGRFTQGGPRISDRTATMDLVSLGLEGRTAAVDWDLTAGYGRVRVINSGRNFFNANLWYPATESGTLDATSNGNDPALVESLKVPIRRDGVSGLAFVDGKVGGELASLPHGPLAYALGFSLWRETLTDNPDALLQQGAVIGEIQQTAVDAARRAKAVFAEVNVPLPMRLEAQLAARYDSYPNAARTSPKAALRWRATDSLMLRGSYSESFKMPRLRQLHGIQDQGAITLESPEECAAIGLPANCGRPAWQVSGGNPNLRPETGKTWSLGGAVDLGPLSATLDGWRIRVDDAIDRPSILQALLEGRTTTNATGELSVLTNLQNYAARETTGLDLDARLRIASVMGGTITLKNATTYFLSLKRKQGPNADWERLLGTYGYPRIRNVLSVGHATPAWLLTAAHKFVGGFRDTNLTAADASPIPADIRRVGSFSQVDVAASYLGWRGTTLTAGIQNLFDRAPPLSLHNAAAADTTQMGFAELYGNRGRFYHLTAEYKFR
jgi:iron complex outermembrane recepter protein